MSPGDGWDVALLFVIVALGAAVAIVLLAFASALAIIIIRSALNHDVTPKPAPSVGTGQQPAVGAVAPRVTPADTVPQPAPVGRVVDDDAVRRLPGR